MKAFNIYMSGVGGQGIGLLAEVLLEAAVASGARTLGVDTHGLAQRGGMVESYLRIGDVRSPLFGKGCADLAVCLELTEGLRAVDLWLREGGCLVCYDTLWQPLSVRIGEAPAVDALQLSDACKGRNAECLIVRKELADIRMQNVALIGALARRSAIPGVLPEHYEKALADVLSPKALQANLRVFRDHD